MISHASNRKFFTRIDNATLRDKQLSLGARGTLALMLTNKLNFTVSIAWLLTQTDEGRRPLMRYIGELAAHGYADLAENRRGEHGRMGSLIVNVRELPVRETRTGDTSKNDEMLTGPVREVDTGPEQGKDLISAGRDQCAITTVDNAHLRTTALRTTTTTTTTTTTSAETSRDIDQLVDAFADAWIRHGQQTSTVRDAAAMKRWVLKTWGAWARERFEAADYRPSELVDKAKQLGTVPATKVAS